MRPLWLIWFFLLFFSIYSIITYHLKRLDTNLKLSPAEKNSGIQIEKIFSQNACNSQGFISREWKEFTLLCEEYREDIYSALLWVPKGIADADLIGSFFDARALLKPPGKVIKYECTLDINSPEKIPKISQYIDWCSGKDTYGKFFGAIIYMQTGIAGMQKSRTALVIRTRDKNILNTKIHLLQKQVKVSDIKL